MKREAYVGIFTVLAVLVASSIAETNMVITSFGGNGEISVSNLWTNATCRVEWRSSLTTGEWMRSWQTLDREDTGTNTTRTFRVPVFYRVVMTKSDEPMGMVLVDAGAFQMGDAYAEGSADELPVHGVHVDTFWIDRYEVTKARWDVVRDWGLTNGYTDLPSGGGGLRASPPGYRNEPDHPLTGTTWNDCVKWCNARSEMDDLSPAYYASAAQTTVYRTGTVDLVSSFVDWDANGYRLPTEAEWEKACRGGRDRHHFPWPSFGGNWSHHIGRTTANYYSSGDPSEGDGDGTTRIGYYNGAQQVTNETGAVLAPSDMANGYGLYDMAGNLYEWCWDRYSSNYYTTSPSANPRGPDTGSNRVCRGGSYFYLSDGMRCAQRGRYEPLFYHTQSGTFRCVRKP